MISNKFSGLSTAKANIIILFTKIMKFTSRIFSSSFQLFSSTGCSVFSVFFWMMFHPYFMFSYFLISIFPIVVSSISSCFFYIVIPNCILFGVDLSSIINGIIMRTYSQALPLSVNIGVISFLSLLISFSYGFRTPMSTGVFVTINTPTQQRISGFREIKTGIGFYLPAFCASFFCYNIHIKASSIGFDRLPDAFHIAGV